MMACSEPQPAPPVGQRSSPHSAHTGAGAFGRATSAAGGVPEASQNGPDTWLGFESHHSEATTETSLYRWCNIKKKQ